MATAKQISPDKMVEAAQYLTESELDGVIRSFHAVQARRRANVLIDAESKLLETINNAPGPEFQQRYKKLIGKRRNETLTEDEYVELLQLTGVAERYQVDRLDALIKLSHLRNVSLEQIMADLNIAPPAVE